VLYPGAAAALDALDGWRLAVCTNKPAAIAERILVALGIRDRFACVIGGDSLSVRKPDPAPLWAALGPAGGLLVGDSATDVRTARAAGVPVIWVPWGYPGPDGPPPPADATLGSFAELPAAVVQLLGDAA
jgi:phosphoglycolate phosphatase